MSIQFFRAWAMPNKQTFSIGPIKKWIESQLVDCEANHQQVWLDPFAGLTPFTACTTNDLNPNVPSQFTMPAVEFLKMYEDESVDGVFFDPPYSPRQIKECYEGFGKTVTQQDTQSSFWGDCKKEIARIVKPGGHVFSFGWNSGGIGKTKGFEIKSILLVAHGGWHNDTICTLEVKR